MTPPPRHQPRFLSPDRLGCPDPANHILKRRTGPHQDGVDGTSHSSDRVPVPSETSSSNRFHDGRLRHSHGVSPKEGVNPTSYKIQRRRPVVPRTLIEGRTRTGTRVPGLPPLVGCWDRIRTCPTPTPLGKQPRLPGWFDLRPSPKDERGPSNDDRNED